MQPRRISSRRHYDALRAHPGRCGRARPLRAAFVMQLNGDEHLAEYKKRHDGTDPHWDGPKAHLLKTLSGNGVRNYSIFHLPDTNQLFAYAEQVLFPPLANLPNPPQASLATRHR